MFANHPLLNPIRSDDEALLAYLSKSNRMLIVSPVEIEGLPSRNQVYIVEQPARGIVDLQPSDKEVRLYTTDEHRQRSAELLRPLDQTPKVVLHPNSSWEIRTWPSERWKQLTHGLLELGVQVVVVGSDVPNIGATEQNILKCVFDLGLDHPSLLDLTNQTSLHELREVIALCDLVITVDSGVLHVANCTDTHVLAIFTDIDRAFVLVFATTNLTPTLQPYIRLARNSIANHGMEAQANAFSLNINACAACRPWNKCSTRQWPFSATRLSRDGA